MTNITQMKPLAVDALQAARAEYLYGELKAERWSLRLLESQTGIPKSTLASKFNGSSPVLAADIELFAEILKRDAVKLFADYLSVGPAGIEPTTSTVEAGRFTDLADFRDRKRKQQYPPIGEIGA